MYEFWEYNVWVTIIAVFFVVILFVFVYILSKSYYFSLLSKKEKQDVDNLLKGSIKKMFEEHKYQELMTKEQVTMHCHDLCDLI